MKIACLQLHAGSVLDHAKTYQKILAKLDEAGQTGADLAVLPECAYPAYFLGLDLPTARKALKHTPNLIQNMAALAVKHDMYIAAGLALERDGELYNSALMLDPEGKVVHTADKSCLWQFDERWFSPGENYGVFQTRHGKMGMMICADARVPEIARILALKGARIIVDPANLAAAATVPQALTNPQVQYLLSARAAENGVWIVMADKVGLEAGFAGYLGSSMVVDPLGEIVARASTDREEILYHELDPELGGQPPGPARRPHLYSLINQDNALLPAVRDLDQAVNMRDGGVYACAAHFVSPNAAAYLEQAGHFLNCAGLAGSRLILLPQAEFPLESLVDRLVGNMPDGLLAVLPARDRDGVKAAAAFTAGGRLDRWRKTHADPAGEPVSGEPFHCLDSGRGKLAVIFDTEAYVPEIARCHMLAGCNLLLWADSCARRMDTKILQTRAAENRIFVVRSSSAPLDSASLCDCEGRVLAATFPDAPQMTGAMFQYPLSLGKTVAPGTDALFGRRGGSYGMLCV